MNQANIIDQEIRIRLLEELIQTNKEDTKTFRIEINESFRNIDQKIDGQFKWIIGAILGLFCGTFVPFFGAIILHMAKLI